MQLKKIINANGTVISVTTTATLLKSLIDTAAGVTDTYDNLLNAINLYVEDGDIRILYDGNTPTASKGILLKRGSIVYLRKISLNELRLISATSSAVAVSVQIGVSDPQEVSAITHVPFFLDLLYGEDAANDLIKVEQRFSYLNIVLAAPTTTVVKSGVGFLHAITINKVAATGVITIYDNTAGSGTLIGTITMPATLLASQITLLFDVVFSVGLTIVTATAAQDITVSYR